MFARESAKGKQFAASWLGGQMTRAYVGRRPKGVYTHTCVFITCPQQLKNVSEGRVHERNKYDEFFEIKEVEFSFETCGQKVFENHRI